MNTKIAQDMSSQHKISRADPWSVPRIPSGCFGWGGGTRSSGGICISTLLCSMFAKLQLSLSAVTHYNFFYIESSFLVEILRVLNEKNM